MGNKEERILIARSTDYTLSNTDKGELFEGKIAPHCANVYTRPEAISKIETRLKVFLDNLQKNKDKVMPWYSTRDIAEVALNALLEGEKR